MTRIEIAAAIAAIHADVDRRTAPLVARHASRLRCARGCTDCCVDDLTVFEVEAERIREHVADGLAGAEPHRAGACAFLDADGACRIYAARPYVCRTQGLPLRWIEDGAPTVPVEHRDICPLNDDGSELSALAVEECWTLGATEGELAGLQVAAQADKGFSTPKRTALRALFAELAGTGRR